MQRLRVSAACRTSGQGLPIYKRHQRAGRNDRPLLVARERLGGNHRHAILHLREGGKVHFHLFIAQGSRCEGILAHQVMQMGAGMRPQGRAVGQQHVEGAVACNLRHQFGQGVVDFFHTRQGGVRLGQFLHQPAKGVFAIGIAHGAKVAVQQGLEIFEIAVVGKHPVVPPQLAHKRMAVLQGHHALRGFADVRHDVAALDGIAPHQFGNRRGAGGIVVDEQAQAFVGNSLLLSARRWVCRVCRACFAGRLRMPGCSGYAFKKSDAPAIGMLIGYARPLTESAEAERDIRGRIAIHSQKLTHEKTRFEKLSNRQLPALSCLLMRRMACGFRHNANPLIVRQADPVLAHKNAE